jgi:uncharacterized circularly permuted ATP-grasp superfamily protein
MKNINKEMKRFLDIYKNLENEKTEQFDEFIKIYGVNFNLYKNGEFLEQGFPFDIIPRIISKSDFDEIEKGVKQRIYALNAFLNDIYDDAKIVKDGVIPSEFVYTSKAFLPKFIGLKTLKNIRTHISGIDFVRETKSGKWIILEDNLRVPSGASYPLSIRKVYRKIYPEFFKEFKVKNSSDYPKKLSQMADFVSAGGASVVLTPGRFNSAFYEHSFMAGKMGTPLCTNDDLSVKGGKLYFKHFDGGHRRVGALYRRLDDDFLDPVEFNPDSMIGIPNIINAYRNGELALINAVGNGVADDKGLYYFVPQMIKYYLGEEPILSNAPTYLPFYEKDRKYVLSHMDKLVIKDVAEAGGYGVLFGSNLSKKELKKVSETIEAEPRRFIAQEVVEFEDLPCFIKGKVAMRKADLRVFALYGEDVYVMPGGLTRYSTIEGNYIVNSSQGGGFKDTWVLEE